MIVLKALHRIARRIASLTALATVLFAAPAPALTLAPGHLATVRVRARVASEVVARAQAESCRRWLAATIDGRPAVRVRIGRHLSDHHLGAVSAGWHLVVLRAAAGGCRGAVRVSWIGVRAARRGGSRPTGGPSGPGHSPAPPPVQDANPFAGAHLYVDPNSNAAATERAWRAENRTADANAMAKIADSPQAQWIGDWDGQDPSAAVHQAVTTAAASGALPVLVAYNLPGRDCSGYSAGGAGTADAYHRWIDGFAHGIGAARAVVILEPDAIPELDCMSAADQETTLALLRYAVDTFAAQGATSAYLDAGHSGWRPASVIASRLKQAGVAQARGFSLNVSNFDWTSSEERYGDAISSTVGDKHFLVDTSRNGQGPASDGSWCNPPGRGLGRPATTATGDPRADALLWVKAPGESDGPCNGGPAAGVWWPAYALALAQHAAF